ncbi:unnamed protein product [Rhizoctonia solani]|uniref:Uncharacterized protein n=1 Tax=Rhizoctonia solani TaxID=456999 RepID=A0A8H3GSQ9_9AGAM|nr:unnamed protein product [Rhizoctonia solani]
MESIPGKINRIPPVTKFVLAATVAVSLPAMLGILPATSIVFDPHYAFERKQIWRIVTAWFYAPSSEFFLFAAGLFLLYHSAFDLETNIFEGRSADYAWQLILSAICIMALNVPLKNAILSRPLLHLMIYRDSYSVKSPYISVLDLAYIPRRYLPWLVLVLDFITGGPLAMCRSLTGALVAHIWQMLIPRPSIFQTAESKTADDGPKKPLPGWRKYSVAPGWAIMDDEYYVIDYVEISSSAASTISLIYMTTITILPKLSPGTLLYLFIKDYGARTITNQENNVEGLAGWELPTPESCGVSQERLDSIVRPIKSLRLGGQFFPWTSPAYHGLVELHLLFTRPKCGHRPYIHAHRLRDMLLASPELRIFHINISVIGKIDLQDSSPVPLDNLEEFSLRGMSRGVYDVLLPLLAPGKKPLQFTFQTQQEVNPPLYCPTVISFLQRANVTSLYILGRTSFDQRLSIDELLAVSPSNLRTLGLEHLQIIDLAQTQDKRHKTLSQLSRLYIRKCAIDVDAFQQLVKLLPVRALKLHKPEIQGRLRANKVVANQEINSMVPVVKWVRSSRDMELWDAWEIEYDELPGLVDVSSEL